MPVCRPFPRCHTRLAPSLARSLATGVILVPLAAGAAWFHLRLVRAEPAADARLTASPPRIALWYSEHPELAVTRVRVTDARGNAVPLGTPTRADSTGAPVVVRLLRPVAPGRYTVAWRTMARDGHMNEGQYAFTVDAGGGR